MSASVFPSPKARLLMRAVIPTCGWLFVAIAGALEAQPALARLDADLRHEVAAPRARLAWLERPDGAAHVHAIVRWGAPSASPAAIATAAILREVLRLRMPAGDGAATAVVPPQDPLLLGLDAINHLELTWRFEGTGPQSWSLGRVLDAPVTDAQVAAARDGVRARLAGRLADPTAVGFAAVAALAEPAVAPDRWDEWLARVSAAEVEALRMTVASGAMWTLGGVGPRASRFAVVSAAADLTGGASAWEDAPPVARDDAAGTGRREAVTRASAAGAAGWGFLAVVRPMPVSATHADWPAMQLAAWLLGASPSRRRFDADVATGGVLGGGAAFDADARGGGLSLWALLAGGRESPGPVSATAAAAAWQRALARLVADGTDAEVQRAAAEWVAHREATRRTPAAQAAQIAWRVATARSFAGWDGVREARVRALDAAALRAALGRHIGPDGWLTVIVNR